MPYQLAFTKPLKVDDPGKYYNDCCYGGDIVVAELLPVVSQGRSEVRTEQEDWGWFIWCKEGSVDLAVDVFCDDPDKGTYRIFLTSKIKRFGMFEKIEDAPALESLRQVVASKLESWTGVAPSLLTLDANHDPVGGTV